MELLQVFRILVQAVALGIFGYQMLIALAKFTSFSSVPTVETKGRFIYSIVLSVCLNWNIAFELNHLMHGAAGGFHHLLKNLNATQTIKSLIYQLFVGNAPMKRRRALFFWSVKSPMHSWYLYRSVKGI